MPIYEYCCDDCDYKFEVMQKITEAPLVECPKCQGKIRRLISPAAFVLKGSGWYVTDYPSADRKKAVEKEQETSKSSSNASSDSGTKTAPSTTESSKKD